MANKRKLIEANQLKTDMYLLATMGDNENIFIDVIIDEIDNADEVDAVEVVHGRWINPSKPYLQFRILGICSECETWADRNYNYCPNCGAKMDGDGNG